MTKKKKQAEALEKQHKATVKKLRAELAAADKAAARWKKKAKQEKEKRSATKAELAKARRALAASQASVTKWKDRAKTAPAPTAAPEPAAATEPAPPPSVAAAASAGDAGAPDDSWTVTRLRAEARSRGIAGYSRKTKDQLLVELRG